MKMEAKSSDHVKQNRERTSTGETHLHITKYTFPCTRTHASHSQTSKIPTSLSSSTRSVGSKKVRLRIIWLEGNKTDEPKHATRNENARGLIVLKRNEKAVLSTAFLLLVHTPTRLKHHRSEVKVEPRIIQAVFLALAIALTRLDLVQVRLGQGTNHRHIDCQTFSICPNRNCDISRSAT